MSIIQQDSPLAVDRSEETMSTQQSGYASTIQVTRDGAAERRNRVFQVMWIAWAILGVVEISREWLRRPYPMAQLWK